MNDQKLLNQLCLDLASVPFIAGVSNHMGSKLTEDSEKMTIILSELKRRGLYFLDSQTSPRSVGLAVAKTIALRATGRTVFLDHSLQENTIREKMEELMRVCISTGTAVGIGHPHSPTINAVRRAIPKMKEKGIEIVPVSALLE